MYESRNTQEKDINYSYVDLDGGVSRNQGSDDQDMEGKYELLGSL